MYESYTIEYTYTDPWDKTISDYHYCDTKEEADKFIEKLMNDYKNYNLELERLFVTHSKQLI